LVQAELLTLMSFSGMTRRESFRVICENWKNGANNTKKKKLAV
jgi:hypothetical protein